MFYFLLIKNYVFQVCLQENNFKTSTVITSSLIREQKMLDEKDVMD